MRVTHLGKFYPPVAGGMERVLQALCEGERARGIDSRALVAGLTRRTVEEDVNGVPVIRAGSIARAGSVWVAPALISRLRRTAADIVVLHEPNPMALLAYAIARPRSRLILWYHCEVLRSRWRYRLFYEPFLRLPLRTAARVIVSSPALPEHAAALAPHRSRCEVVPFGLDVDRATDGALHPAVAEVRTRWSGPVALFVGRLVPYKGVDVLLRALVRSPGVAAVIVGDGPLRAELEQQATRLGIAARAFFAGRIDDPALAAWYEACDMFVLPSVTRAEAFGLVQLEAMARGKPVVSTRLPTGVPWVNVDGVTGLTVAPGCDRALGEAMQTLAADDVGRRTMGAAAKARYEAEFRRDRMVERTTAVYARVLAGPPPAPRARIKRLFDAGLAAVGLIASAPVWAAAAALIKLEDGGPVFFRQARVGLNGATFTVLKFRSMVVDAERAGPLQASAGDARVTRVGRLMRATAMDELPQLVNILKGDMSFVGPRALRPGEIEATGDGRVIAMEEIAGYHARTAVQPGLTGIAQIYAPRDVARRHKFRYDRVYVRRRSFWLDIRLIALSFWISLRGTWEHRQRKF